LTDFTTLGLAAPLLQALATEGYAAPTPIQAQAIPIIMTGRDLLGIAQTGTGKTAAFALPILHQLAARRKPAPRGGCRVLVLAPTRELASQIAKSFKTYGAGLHMTVAAVYGGVPAGPQIKALAGGVDVLVATPGRLVDHMDSHRARLNGAEFLVLDEIDQMLDLGFVKPIRRIVGELPKQRQNLFFSATMPAEIRKLASEFLVNPATVSVAPVATTAERVQHQVVFIEAARKRTVLVELFGDAAMTRAIVFTRTKRGADKVAQHLENAGISTSAIHGNKSQGQRERSLSAFKAGRVRALVATDIAARGIDIDDVSHVINFELPEVPENYVHRIGRTARAGAAGVAISLCDGEERNLLRNIEKLTRLNLPSVDRRSGEERVVAKRLPARSPVRSASRPAGRSR
jgi:ATP-dependent RNA helicase RhlE